MAVHSPHRLSHRSTARTRAQTSELSASRRGWKWVRNLEMTRRTDPRPKRTRGQFRRLRSGGLRPVLWADKRFCVPSSLRGQTHDIIGICVTARFCTNPHGASHVTNSAESLIACYINFPALKNAVFWDVTPCDSSKQPTCTVLRLLVTANVVPTSPILATLKMKVLRSSETSVLTRAARRNIPGDGILHSDCRGNLKSYIALTGWTL
jgi:hypothetical protein